MYDLSIIIFLQELFLLLRFGPGIREGNEKNHMSLSWSLCTEFTFILNSI
jgi:hypothetical protein